MTAPSPRTAWTWAEHCRHCTWWVLAHYGKPVATFTTRNAMADYVRTHPRGPET